MIIRTKISKNLRLLEFKFPETKSYKYVLEKAENNKWIKIKRWEKHLDHGGPHVHIYKKNGKVKKIKDKKRNRNEILKEIREKYDVC